jgi:hypothetical protein
VREDLHGHNNHVDAFSVVLEEPFSEACIYCTDCCVWLWQKDWLGALHDASPIHEVFLLFFFEEKSMKALALCNAS